MKRLWITLLPGLLALHAWGEALAAPPVAVADSLTFPATATSPIDVLANDSDADDDSLTITAVSGPGFSVAPDGSSLRFNLLSAPTIPFAVGEYTVSDGSTTATALVALSNAAEAPEDVPGWPSAYRARRVVMDPINNRWEQSEIDVDLVAQAQLVRSIISNPNENPVGEGVLSLPGSGFRYRFTPDGLGGENCAVEADATPIIPLLPDPDALFLGFENVVDRRLERWLVPDVSPGSDAIVTGQRRRIGSETFLVPHMVQVRLRDSIMVTQQTRYSGFVVHRNGTPDPGVFAAPAVCP